MADKYIEIKIEDEKDIILGLERMEARQQRKLREIMVELSNVASLSLISLVPQYSNYIMNQINREGPTWMPGGAGGGGEWKGIVGVREGASRHPLYVEFGTGIYAGRGLIWARRGGLILTGRRQSVMTFQKQGEPRKFRYWIRGQRGQHYFYTTWQALNAYARVRMSATDLYS